MDGNASRTKIQLTLPHSVRHWSIYRPNKAALIWEGGLVTYAALQQKIDSVRILLRPIGLQRQSAIGILVSDKAQFITAVLAVLSEAFVPVLLNLQAPRDVLATMVADASCKALLIESDDQEEMYRPLGLPAIRFNGATEGSDKEAYSRDSGVQYVDDIWGIIYSSGTTGTPKGIVRTQFSLLNEMIGWCLELPIDRDSI